MTGFLDSGKTGFLKFTLKQDYFQIDGKTLLILCEDGEDEYDAMEMLDPPALRKLHIFKITDLPHSVIFNDNSIRLVLSI